MALGPTRDVLDLIETSGPHCKCSQHGSALQIIKKFAHYRQHDQVTARLYCTEFGIGIVGQDVHPRIISVWVPQTLSNG